MNKILLALHNSYLTHPIIAIPLAALAYLIGFYLGPHWGAAFAGTLFYYSREIRDAEVKARMNFAADLGKKGICWAFRMWWVGNWPSKDEQMDFWPAAILLHAIALAAELVPLV